MPLSRGENGDILTTVDHRDEETARTWAIESALKRPWRPRFRGAFSQILGERGPAPQRILELGSGPGLLAERVLRNVLASEYVLFDFSAAMMSMARETLGARDEVTYHVGDFKSDSWHLELEGPFDAVVSMQAVHEVRHKRHVAPLYARVRTLLRPLGLLLVCDHEPAPQASELARELASTEQEQREALLRAGFMDVRSRLREHGCYLLSAAKPATM